MKNVSKVALAFVAGVVLMGCDSIKDAASSVPTMEAPEVSTSRSSALFREWGITITSKDNDMTIDEVIVNRGNCGVMRYRCEDNLKIYSGKIKEDSLWKNMDMDYYNALSPEEKAKCEPIAVPSNIASPTYKWGEKIPYGETAFIATYGCSTLSEIVIKTNGGTFTFGD